MADPIPLAGSPARAVFLEEWWLDAAAPGAWSAVSDRTDGRERGWLPYATRRRDGVQWCGLAPLTRLAYPVLSIAKDKHESVAREHFQVESGLIQQLPPASVHEFVLPPDHANALAWQAHGFEARVQHTFRIAAGTSEATMWGQMNRKTRNLIRRAQEQLTPRHLDGSAFAALYRNNLGDSVAPAEVAAVERLATASIARSQGRVIGVVDGAGRTHAAALFVWDARDAFYFLSTRAYGEAALGAVDLLVWLGMTDAMTRGLRFDFDGVSSASRLRFLQSFGGQLASRIVVTRRRPAYDARLLARRLRHHLTQKGEREEFP